MPAHNKLKLGFDKILSTFRNEPAYRRLPDHDIDDLMPSEEPTVNASSNAGQSGVSTESDDVSEGHLVVYAGQERKQLVIKIDYLNHKLFKELLKKSEEAFGLDNPGGLRLDCEPAILEDLMWFIDNIDKESFQVVANNFSLDQLMEHFRGIRSGN